MRALCDQKPKRLTLLDEYYHYYFSCRLTRHMIMITKNVGTWWRKPSARGTSNHGVVLSFCFCFFCLFVFFLEPVVLAIYLSL